MAAYTNTLTYGVPTTGWFLLNDTITDAGGTRYKCTAAGNPGLWAQADTAVDQSTNATDVGAVNTVTGLACAIVRTGAVAKLTFTLTAVSMTVTDGAGSGSHGTVKLFDFVQSAVSFLGCRQNYTAYVEGAALTTAAGDAVFAIGVGTTAISAAADGVLAAGNVNVGGSIAQTNSSGTTTGTLISGAVVAGVDGTTTAATLNLNWSGTAATIDATSTIDITGTITVLCALLGDD